MTTDELLSYSKFIVAFSGGKDSLACALWLLDVGVPRERIELWHHDVDGREGSKLMDWPCTRDYCRRVAAALDLPLFFSWKVGGFEREMCRNESPTAPTMFETPEGLGTSGGNGPPGTREKFPQVSADLKVRWCSSYVKIDVCSSAIRNQPRFDNSRTLVISGERGEESPARSKYKLFEPDRATSNTRHVDRWRPVLRWPEIEVWSIIRKHGIVPHPAYRLGWGRVSCAACIFGSPNQWASLRAVNPAQFAAVAEYERAWKTTIQRKRTIVELADAGRPYPAIARNPDVVAAALAGKYEGVVQVSPEAWTWPAGAFAESTGPT